MNTPSMLIVSFGLLIAGLCWSCASKATPTADKGGAMSGQIRSFEGTLQGGLMGIGGEHTGWVLERSSTEKVEVDVKAVAQTAHQFQGRRVRITGTMVTKPYVERGPTPILVASKIEQATN